MSKGAASARNETLLGLRHGGSKLVHGFGAIRVGKRKLLHGLGTVASGTDECTSRRDSGGWTATEVDENGEPVKVPFDANVSTPLCPNGWTLPPHTGASADPMPPPDVTCESLPCTFDTSRYITGGTLLFDVVQDPFEREDLATKYPDVVKDLLSRLQKYNASGILPDKGGKDPSASPRNFDGVWTPWRGNPDPAACDANENPSPPSVLFTPRGAYS